MRHDTNGLERGPVSGVHPSPSLASATLRLAAEGRGPSLPPKAWCGRNDHYQLKLTMLRHDALLVYFIIHTHPNVHLSDTNVQKRRHAPATLPIVPNYEKSPLNIAVYVVICIICIFFKTKS